MPREAKAHPLRTGLMVVTNTFGVTLPAKVIDEDEWKRRMEKIKQGVPVRQI